MYSTHLLRLSLVLDYGLVSNYGLEKELPLKAAALFHDEKYSV
jgi:hypothetical protein